MSVRRLLPLILINILVSAAVVLLILTWWDRRQESNVVGAAATVQVTLPPAVEDAPPVADGTTAAPATSAPPSEGLGENIYIVQVGDTLGSIGSQLDVSIEDIIAANNLANPDLLAVGQELTIPEEGFTPEDNQAEASEPTPEEEGATLAPLPTEPLASGIVLVEITEVVGIGDEAAEAVSIVNFGDIAVALQGWQLSSEEGRTYIFGQVTLFGEGAGITVYTTTGRDGPSELYWGETTAAWESGQTITLTDEEGVVQATFVVP